MLLGLETMLNMLETILKMLETMMTPPLTTNCYNATSGPNMSEAGGIIWYALHITNSSSSQV